MWWMMVVFWGIFLAVGAEVFLSPDMPLVGQVVGAAIAMVIVGWIAYARRAGIEVDDRQVIVRRYLGRSTAVPWDEVSGFELVPNSRKHKGVFVSVVLVDGRRLSTSGLCARSPDSPRAQQFLADLAAMRPPA